MKNARAGVPQNITEGEESAFLSWGTESEVRTIPVSDISIKKIWIAGWRSARNGCTCDAALDTCPVHGVGSDAGPERGRDG